ncbi:MAG: exosortase-associated protein EpsI, B-type [Gallionella sp.]
MKKPLTISIILGVLMVSSGALTMAMAPSVQTLKQNKINLEVLIPSEFNDWKIDLSAASLMVNPDVKETINKIYSQTLSRSYINSKGERVMLSIAYGSDQSTDLQVHRPEVCYLSGGFDVGKMTKTFVDTSIGQIPVMHLVAKQGSRNEPITYWIRVGDSLTRGWIEQKVVALSYGLTGKVPDGLLFRVSTISNDEQDSYRIQQVFLAALLQAVRSEDRYWLVGRLNT